LSVSLGALLLPHGHILPLALGFENEQAAK